MNTKARSSCAPELPARPARKAEKALGVADLTAREMAKLSARQGRWVEGSAGRAASCPC